METVRIGVIGGSGLYNMAGLTDRQSYDLETPFGKPSAPVVVGTLSGQRVAFIPRHGAGHRFTPTEVPYCANVFAFKLLGVTHVIGVSACGSLKEAFKPGHIVVPDQVVDLTRDRRRTFFGEGLVAHVSLAHPFGAKLSTLLAEVARDAGGTVHQGGTYVTIEGPRFSTRGESLLFRQWGMGIIGMTTSPEAFLAREAEMHYAVMAHVTDYDCWHEDEEPVTTEMVVATFNRNLEIARQALILAVERLGADLAAYTEDDVTNALASAFLTSRDAVSPETIARLRPIIGRYFQ